MKLLNAKNKKMAITALAAFAGLILVAAIVRATKAGAKTAGEISKKVTDEIKAMISFGNVVLILVTVGMFLATQSIGATAAAGVSYAVALGTLTTGAGVVSVFNSTYVPKTFSYTAATQLTGVKITVEGDGVIFDGDANALNHCGVSRVVGQVTNTYILRLTNGFIKNKNVIWEFTNSAAQTPVIYVNSDQKPAVNKATGKPNPMYLQLLRQAVLANSGQDFSKFSTLSFPSIAATDTVNVLFRDGHQQQFNRADIQHKLGYQQNVVNTPVYTIDNYAQTIKVVNIIAGAAQTAVVQRWVKVGGGMISQVVNF